MEDGSQRRKDLSEKLRSLSNDDGPRFSTMRECQPLPTVHRAWYASLSTDGKMRIVALDSSPRTILSPIAKALVEKHSWNEVWAIEEANLLFPGMTQGVAILGISSTPNGTESLNIIGPVTRPIYDELAQESHRESHRSHLHRNNGFNGQEHVGRSPFAS